MRGVAVTQEIAAPPERAFALAADLAGAGAVFSGIARLELLTQGPVGVGTRFRETRVMFGRESSEEMTVLAFDPPRAFLVGNEAHGCRYRKTFAFAPDGAGTRATVTFEAEPLTLMAKVMAVLLAFMAKSIAKLIARDLADLKRAAETRAR